MTDTDKSQFSKKLGLKLQKLRHASGLSQEKIAQAAGISAYTYQKFEKGESRPSTPMNPRLFTLMSLANVYKMTVGDLLDFDVSENATPHDT